MLSEPVLGLLVPVVCGIAISEDTLDCPEGGFARDIGSDDASMQAAGLAASERITAVNALARCATRTISNTHQCQDAVACLRLMHSTLASAAPQMASWPSPAARVASDVLRLVLQHVVVHGHEPLEGDGRRVLLRGLALQHSHRPRQHAVHTRRQHRAVIRAHTATVRLEAQRSGRSSQTKGDERICCIESNCFSWQPSSSSWDGGQQDGFHFEAVERKDRQRLELVELDAHGQEVDLQSV